MTEKKLKGLFGGGEADDAPSAARAGDRPHRGGRERRGGGGGRRGGGRRSPEERSRREDFINRYTTGNPSEGFSSEEAVGYLRELRGEVPPEVMQRAAVETVRHLPDEQRKEFAEMLERRRAGSGMVTIERTGEARAAEGRDQAQGGGMDDMFGSLFGGLLGGGAAQPAPQPQQQPQGGMPGMDDMLGGLLGGLLGGGGPAPSTGGRASQANDPFGDLLGGLLGGGMEAPEPELQRQRQQPQEQGGGMGDILGSPLGKAVLGGIAAFAMKEMMDKDRQG
jgi:hypothetical protein